MKADPERLKAYEELVARYDAGEPTPDIGRGRVYHALRVLGRKANRKGNVLADAESVRHIMLTEKLTSSQAVADHFGLRPDYVRRKLAELGIGLVEIRREINDTGKSRGRPVGATTDKQRMRQKEVERIVNEPPTRFHTQWANLTERERKLMDPRYRRIAYAVGAWDD